MKFVSLDMFVWTARTAALRCVRRAVVAAAGAAILLSAAGAAIAAEPRYRSVQDAVDQGVAAYRGGSYEIAIDPLSYAASKDDFLARFYLARIYSDNATAYTNHGKAYLLYQRLADEYADMDPDDDRRAVFVAKSLTALAGYLRTGITEIGLKPDLERASQYLHHAATFFNDEDAQFQLAKLILEGSLSERGAKRDTTREKLAIHWLSVLTTEKRHAGAQALLAYLMWRGEHEPLVRKDPQRAVALITVAAENAPIGDRVWIDDYYQEIYCGVASGGRKKLDGMVASYRRQYGQPEGAQLDRRDRSALGGLQPEAERSCANGEPLPPIRRTRQQDTGATTTSSVREAGGPSVARGSMGAAPSLGLMGGSYTPAGR